MIRRLYPARCLVQLALICTLSIGLSPAPGHAATQLVQTPRSGKASSPQIGSVMAVLATLQDAQVLPPEGTPEANHIIKWVIQFQSVFMKSEDASVQAFARRALAPSHGEQAAGMLASLRSTGWTAEMLEALADEEARTGEDMRRTLVPGFGQFNLSVEDFHGFMQLVREAQRSFNQRGLEFRTVFASRRKEMPGAGSS
ncbi:MAG TPA: hypothetical protein VLS44_08020 [Nitrospira sp.]|nr:hypothetical protein [Nitrospira sp.]